MKDRSTDLYAEKLSNHIIIHGLAQEFRNYEGVVNFAVNKLWLNLGTLGLASITNLLNKGPEIGQVQFDSYLPTPP